LDYAALVAQRRTELDFMQAEFGRSTNLLGKGYITRE
jgi:multidrug resistance efflux pump